jgi:hypothetical protein
VAARELKCPLCGSRRVTIAYILPSERISGPSRANSFQLLHALSSDDDVCSLGAFGDGFPPVQQAGGIYPASDETKTAQNFQMDTELLLY